MKHDKKKSHGIHYTPTELAGFLAHVTANHIQKQGGPVEILDPACGGGSLLHAIYNAMPHRTRSRLALFGFEREEEALEEARRVLASCSVGSVELLKLDFLTLEGIDSPSSNGRQRTFFDGEQSEYLGRFDAIIANPPYVRTQVLGARRAQELARRFRLTGRVDLYHAFVKAMANVLKPGGVLGLVTSNRFLTVKSGASLRRLLRSEFQLEEVYDMGDTKLFEAAVLPVILVARKQPPSAQSSCSFDRVYERRESDTTRKPCHRCESILDALLDRNAKGTVETRKGVYIIERGRLVASKGDEVWSLSTPEYEEWLRIIRSNQAHRFDDLGIIRVGIKTCADKVFVRNDWDTLPPNQEPESPVLRTLITHFIANRWRPEQPPGKTRVLYPHTIRDGKCAPIALSQYPKAARYLRLHRERLASRGYVTKAGRKWYEIWVPQNPADWAKPKIVFPDIAELPRFFFDDTGAIVNGDCYWVTLRKGVDDKWLLLMLAVANSSFITRYYDVLFHNKLYAGRRRFMTQYVKEFPIPELDSDVSKRIIRLTASLVNAPMNTKAEAEVDGLVWHAFGLRKEI